MARDYAPAGVYHPSRATPPTPHLGFTTAFLFRLLPTDGNYCQPAAPLSSVSSFLADKTGAALRSFCGLPQREALESRLEVGRL